jgi:hypothetical protein
MMEHMGTETDHIPWCKNRDLAEQMEKGKMNLMKDEMKDMFLMKQK